MPAPWRALEVMMDDIVDSHWGEPVEVFPWSEIGIEEGGVGSDPNRPGFTTTGILVMPGAAATGEAGSGGQGLSARPVGKETWVSFSEHNLVMPLHEFKEHDRVYFPDRGWWFEVNYPLPSVTARPQIYLTRLQTGSIPR